MPDYQSKMREIVETVELVIDRMKAAIGEAGGRGAIDGRALAPVLIGMTDLHYLAMEHEACERAAIAYHRGHRLPRDHRYELATLRARRPGALPVIIARRIDDQAAAG